MMQDASSEPEGLLARLGWALVRFFLSLVFGVLVSVVVFALGIYFVGLDEQLDHLWLTLLWLMPPLWGVLGVFYFDKALALGREIFEAYLRSRWW